MCEARAWGKFYRCGVAKPAGGRWLATCPNLFGFLLKLTINGESVDVKASADTPLLWVLRDELGMSGTKFGCGMGLCGACTVHIDGEATRTCVLPIAAAEGKKITTIEGLARSGNLHPVQQAWMELDVVQCGYCQSGQIMSAAALLQKKAKPTDGDIDDAMAGNICRCGTYERIRAGVKHAAELAAK